jgi:site-specific recombinase XerD
MTPIAPLITYFLREYLPKERGFGQNTCETYAYAFQLFLEYASKQLKIRPSDLQLEQLGSKMVLEFLSDIEKSRGNSASTRNSRLAAIKAFMKFVEFKIPSSIEQVRQIRGISAKRHEVPLIKHLNQVEIQAILNAPNVNTRLGIRDRAMLHLCYVAGLRVSELVELPLSRVAFQKTVSIKVIGKGRRERCLPLWKETAIDLKSWISIRGNVQTPELFVNANGIAIGRAGFEYILDKYVKLATTKVPSLSGRKISPHQLRHSCAVLMLQATRDIRKVSLWLGHADIRTTEIYLRIDPSEKLEAIEAVVPLSLRRGKFKAPDKLIASLLG